MPSSAGFQESGDEGEDPNLFGGGPDSASIRPPPAVGVLGSCSSYLRGPVRIDWSEVIRLFPAQIFFVNFRSDRPPLTLRWSRCMGGAHRLVVGAEINMPVQHRHRHVASHTAPDYGSRAQKIRRFRSSKGHLGARDFAESPAQIQENIGRPSYG